MRVLAAALGIGLGFLPLSAIAQQPADGDGDAVAIATEWDEFAAVEDVPRPEDGAEITAPDPRIEDAISPYPMRVRLSPELDEQQRRIAAQAAQSAAGWIIDEAATPNAVSKPSSSGPFSIRPDQSIPRPSASLGKSMPRCHLPIHAVA